MSLLSLLFPLIFPLGTSTLSDVALTRLIGSQTGGISTSFYNDLKHRSGQVSIDIHVYIHVYTYAYIHVYIHVYA